MPDDDRTDHAIQQLAATVEHWLHLAASHGLIDHEAIRRDPRAWAAQVVAELGSDDPRLAAETALTVSQWCGSADPHYASTFPLDSAWWGTPLGRLCAVAQQSGEISQSEAAHVLGVSRQRVHQMTLGGILTRGPGGGVTRHSVARRIASTREADTLDPATEGMTLDEVLHASGLPDPDPDGVARVRIERDDDA